MGSTAWPTNTAAAIAAGSRAAEVNVTLDPTGRDKWGEWLTPAPFDHVGRTGIHGAFQGAYYCNTGRYRPTDNSQMNQLPDYFNMPSMQKIVRDIYAIVDPIDAHTDNTSPIVNPAQLVGQRDRPERDQSRVVGRRRRRQRGRRTMFHADRPGARLAHRARSRLRRYRLGARRSQRPRAVDYMERDGSMNPRLVIFPPIALAASVAVYARRGSPPIGARTRPSPFTGSKLGNLVATPFLDDTGGGSSSRFPRATRPSAASPIRSPRRAQRLAEQNSLFLALEAALKARDVVGARRLLREHAERFPDIEGGAEDREGFEAIADCLEHPGAESRARAERFIAEHRASSLRRKVRHACLGPRAPVEAALNALQQG